MDKADFQAQHATAFRIASSLGPKELSECRRKLMQAIERDKSLCDQPPLIVP